MRKMNFISGRLRSIQWHFIGAGILFALFSAAILFVPTLVQYIFIVGFFLLGVVCFGVAVRIKHLVDFTDKIFSPIEKRKRR